MTIKCDAIKYSYRQSKDGFVVAFVIHPQEMPDALANADIGSQWQLQLVPLDKDGNADIGTHTRPIEAPRQDTVDTEPVGARRFNSLPLPQQAALLCTDPVFWAFVREEWGGECWGQTDAITAMYDRYDISSRSQLGKGLGDDQMFVSDREQFAAWKLVSA